MASLLLLYGSSISLIFLCYVQIGESSTTIILRPTPSPINSSTPSTSNASSSSLYSHVSSTILVTTTHAVTTALLPTKTAATSTVTPTVTPTVHPNTTVQPTTHTTITPTTGNHTVLPTSVAPTTQECHSYAAELASEKHLKWVAVTFNILFAIALVVMTVLYLRQRKMYREMEGDGSLSRLI